MDAHLCWSERSRDLLARCGVFDLYRARRAAPDGREGDFHVLVSPDWVTVVPVTDDPDLGPCFLMVRQYRHGAELVTTEFPAGLVEPGETPAEAAARELAEETGRRAGSIREIGRVAPNPAFMTNWCTTFLAEELTAAPGAAPDALELLETRLVPVDELVERAGTGEYVNSLVVVGLAWFLRQRGVRA